MRDLKITLFALLTCLAFALSFTRGYETCELVQTGTQDYTVTEFYTSQESNTARNKINDLIERYGLQEEYAIACDGQQTRQVTKTQPFYELVCTKTVVCGDGIVDFAEGEECEIGDPHCNDQCKVEIQKPVKPVYAPTYKYPVIIPTGSCIDCDTSLYSLFQ